MILPLTVSRVKCKLSVGQGSGLLPPSYTLAVDAAHVGQLIVSDGRYKSVHRSNKDMQVKVRGSAL